MLPEALKSLAMIVYLPISLFSSIIFCFMYFEVATTTLQGACSRVKAVRENKEKKKKKTKSK